MITLRYYQEEAVQSLYNFFSRVSGDTIRNPMVVTPTGSGKSLILAAFVKRALTDYPGTRIIVLTHVRELIQQDARAILNYWPEAPIGIWSAGLGVKTRAQVTIAGIQSIHSNPTLFSPCDIVLIDECHLLSKNADTMYRRFLAGLMVHNPALKVIGLTATPYRLDSGLLTDGKDRIFTDIAYTADVARLIKEGFLCPLVSKAGLTRADLSGMHKRGGDFMPAELAARMDQVNLIEGAVQEMLTYGADRKSWLVFCAGVQHAQHVADCLNHYGVKTGMVCGDTPKAERDRLIADFKAGRLRALTNADVLTTGFDHPAIDLIGMLRATESVGLYVQIVGRGLRTSPAKENCLILDFVGNVTKHGPIDAIKVHSKSDGSGGVGVAPAKECPDCQALLHTSIMECPECGHIWESSFAHGVIAGDAPIIAALEAPRLMTVESVAYSVHTKAGKAPSMKVAYQCGIATYHEWVPIEDDRSMVKKHAVKWFWARGLMCPNTVAEALEMDIPTPSTITVKADGKYWRVTGQVFPQFTASATVEGEPNVQAAA